MLGGESSSLKKSFVSDLLLGMGGGGGEESEPRTLSSLSDTSRTPLLQ